jgi:hypothetical protein
MDELSVDHGSPSDRGTIQRGCIRSSGNRAEMSRIAKNVAIEPMNDSILCIDQTRGIFSDSVKHWLQVCGGVSDNPQNLAGGGLLFQRFRELTVTFLQLFVLCFLPQQKFGELLA